MIQPHPELGRQTVLVLAPFGRDAALLTRVLAQAKIDAVICLDMEALCRQVTAGAGAVLVADEALASNGLQVLAKCLEGQEPWSDLPIFVMTQRQGPETWARLKHLEPLGNVTVLERPLRSETLISAFRMGLRARAHQYQLRNRLEAEQNAAQALRESELRYRTLAESMPQLVWTCAANGECDFLSRQWIEYTGIPEEEQLGFRWLDLIHPDDRATTASAWRAAYQSGEQYDLVYRLRRHDGVYRWFKTRGVPGKDSEGRIQKWFGSCTDIEDQRRISEERRELLGREQKARGLAELLNRVGPELLEELDSHALAQTVTDLATQLTGAQFGAFFQNLQNGSGSSYTLTARSGAPPDTIEKLAPSFKGQTTIVSADLTADHALGSEAAGLQVRSYLSAPVVSRSGEVIGALLFGSAEADLFKELQVKLAEGIAAQAAIALDNARLFNEGQQAQETLRRSNVELRRANEDLNQFAYSASHDLQEPLRMVALYSQMMQRKYESTLDQTGAEYLGYMVQGARRMEMLLRDLLDYTQVTSAHEVKAEKSDANAALRSVTQNLAQAITESGAIIDTPELPMLAVKEFHLIQLFQNLLGNALKYRCSETPRITLAVERDGRFWRFSVRDNGIGIAPQYAQQVFGLFRRLHGNSQYEGTGIGLAICQKIAERYDGRIWVQSEGEGKGSTFYFTLPGWDEARAEE